MRYGLKRNLKHIHALKILEFAAAIALVVAPDKASRYLNQLGVKFTLDESQAAKAEETQDLVDDPIAQARFKRELFG